MVTLQWALCGEPHATQLHIAQPPLFCRVANVGGPFFLIPTWC
jgi:hypothetical protein